MKPFSPGVVPAVSASRRSVAGGDDAVLVVAEHRLNLLVVLDRFLRALVDGRAQFGGVAGAFGGLAGTVQQRVVARLDGLGQPPVGLALRRGVRACSAP